MPESSTPSNPGPLLKPSASPTPIALPPPDAEYLRLPDLPGGFRPDYQRCLTGVLPTLFALLGQMDQLGQPLRQRPHLLRHLPPASPRQAERVLLVTVDALGFKELAQGVRLAALQREYGTWITSVFPTITSAALTSLYQSLPPSRHGVLGHLIWKDFPGGIVDMLRMKVPDAPATLAASGFDIRQWQREPGLLDVLSQPSLPPTTQPQPALPGYHLMPRDIVESGLSQFSYGATKRVGYADLLEGLTKAGRMLCDHPRGWVSLYTPTIDTLSHYLTGDGPQMRLALQHLEAALAWMVSTRPAQVVDSTALLVAADHGQDTFRERIALHGERGVWLRQHTRAIGYSGRTLHVYLGGKPAAPVADWFRDMLAGRGMVLPFEQAAPLAGLTPQDDADWVRQSLGDLVVILHAGYLFERREPKDQPQGPYASYLVSQHGALTPNELFTPFICAPLGALA